MTGQITKEIPDDVFMAAIDAFDLSKYPAGTTNTEILALAIMADRASRLSTLPIAGEGKVKALEWSTPRDDEAYPEWTAFCPVLEKRFVIDRGEARCFGEYPLRIGNYRPAKDGFPTLEEAQTFANEYRTQRILSALISSPGKDGGQEVEELRDAKWQVKHVDTMNDIASLRIALEGAEAALAEARKAAFIEAAEIAETLGVYPELNVFAGGPEWYKHGKAIAKVIRAKAEGRP